jgi:hypothetical protein
MIRQACELTSALAYSDESVPLVPGGWETTSVGPVDIEVEIGTGVYWIHGGHTPGMYDGDDVEQARTARRSSLRRRFDSVVDARKSRGMATRSVRVLAHEDADVQVVARFLDMLATAKLERLEIELCDPVVPLPAAPDPDYQAELLDTMAGLGMDERSVHLDRELTRLAVACPGWRDAWDSFTDIPHPKRTCVDYGAMAPAIGRCWWGRAKVETLFQQVAMDVPPHGVPVGTARALPVVLAERATWPEPAPQRWGDLLPQLETTSSGLAWAAPDVEEPTGTAPPGRNPPCDELDRDPDDPTANWWSMDGRHLCRCWESHCAAIFALNPDEKLFRATQSPDDIRSAIWTTGKGDGSVVRVINVYSGELLGVANLSSVPNIGASMTWGAGGNLWLQHGAGSFNAVGHLISAEGEVLRSTVGPGLELGPDRCFVARYAPVGTPLADDFSLEVFRVFDGETVDTLARESGAAVYKVEWRPVDAVFHFERSESGPSVTIPLGRCIP